MAGELYRGEQRARTSLSQLSSPRYLAEAAEQDMRPENVEELKAAIRDPRHQRPMQQQILGDELKRIQGMQLMQLQRAAQAMPQQLQRDLSPAKTGEPWPSPEATMVRLMLQMQRRHGRDPEMLRPDGTRKGAGYFGPISRPDGKVSTELSYSDPERGQRNLAPLLVPGLNRQQIDHLLSGGEPTDEIYNIANRHAASRSLPFANIQEEGRTPLPSR